MKRKLTELEQCAIDALNCAIDYIAMLDDGKQEVAKEYIRPRMLEKNTELFNLLNTTDNGSEDK